MLIKCVLTIETQYIVDVLQEFGGSLGTPVIGASNGCLLALTFQLAACPSSTRVDLSGWVRLLHSHSQSSLLSNSIIICNHCESL